MDGNLKLQIGGLGNTQAFIYTPASVDLSFFTGATERARITSGGNVGIGTASPGATLDVRGQVLARVDGAGTTTPLVLRNDDVTGVQVVKVAFDSSGAIKSSINAAVFGNDYMAFNVGSDTERMRIDASGNVGIGTASPGAQLHVNADFIVNSTAKFGAEVACVANADNLTAPLVSWNKDTSGNNFFAGFVTEGGAGTLRGTIQYNRGTGQVVYNTTSDARLKENITPAEEAGARIDAMQVRQFDWKESGTHVHHGFVAQELYAVAPEAVSASDDESVMWAVDYSKLVPLMVKEIQSLRARLAALEGE
jgi:hypothetical protein